MYFQAFGTGLLVFLGCMGVHGASSAPDPHLVHLGVTLSFGVAAFIAIQV